MTSQRATFGNGIAATSSMSSVSIATTLSDDMLLLSVTVDLEKWLIESLRTSSKRNMAPGYKTASTPSAALSLVWLGSFSMLQLHCSIHLVGCVHMRSATFPFILWCLSSPRLGHAFCNNTPRAALFGGVGSLFFLSHLCWYLAS